MAYTNEQTAEQRALAYKDAGIPMPKLSPIAPVAPLIDAAGISSAPMPLIIKPGSTPQIPDISNLLSSVGTTPVIPIAPQTEATSFNDRLNALLGQSKNKATDLQSQIGMETSPYNQQLNELNTQIKMHQANSIANQEKAMRSGETLGYASREAQNVQRTDAIEALKLSAIAEGLQGNIALATQHATNAINAKYAQIESDIENTKTQIYDNYESFTPAEKKRADATLLRLDAQDAFVKEKKADEAQTQKFIQDAITAAGKAGIAIDNSILQNASKAKTSTEALQILAPYLGAQEPDLQFVSGTANQAAGYFDKNTGKFTATRGGSGGGSSAGGNPIGGQTNLSPLSQSVISNPSLFYNFTPTQKGQIVSELQGAGYDISGLQNSKLTQSQQDDIAQMSTVNNLIGDILAYNVDGSLDGIGAFGTGTLKSIASQLGIGSKEGQDVRALIGNIKGTIAKLRGGTSFTTNEEKLLDTYVPSINDSSAVAVNKLHLLQDFIAQKNSDLLNTAQTNITTGQIKKTGDQSSVEGLRAKYNY